MLDTAAIEYLRHRRATYFFGDSGPPLPSGLAARWRLSTAEPRAWHANMVGFLEAPPARLGELLDIAVEWFGRYRVDVWVDVDEYGPLFREQHLLDRRRFRLGDDWDAMLCHRVIPPARRAQVELRPAEDEAMLLEAAWVAEGADRHEPLLRGDLQVQARFRRFVREYRNWNSRFVVAYLNGEPVGTARLTQEDLPVILGVATVPAARNRGVATTVVAALVQRALAEHTACALYVERGSQAARIYHGLGFIPLFRSRAWVRPWSS